MSDLRCARTDLPVAWCAHCRDTQPLWVIDGDAGDADDDTMTFGVHFTARYRSRCALCAKTMEEGEKVTPILDDNNRADGYACASCIRSRS